MKIEMYPNDDRTFLILFENFNGSCIEKVFELVFASCNFWADVRITGIVSSMMNGSDGSYI